MSAEAEAAGSADALKLLEQALECLTCIPIVGVVQRDIRQCARVL